MAKGLCKACGMKKGFGEPKDADEAGDEAGDEGDEKDMEMANKAKKSVDLTSDDLEKSLQKLEGVIMGSDQTSRKDALLAQAQTSELSKSEREELFNLLGGAQEVAATPAEDVAKGLKENSTLQKALDVSDYLTEQHTELCKSLSSLGEVVQKSDSRQHEFNLVLAKAVSDVGNLVKAVAETVGAIAGQPARAPKSAGVQGGKVLSKSFAGNTPAEGQLSKSEILETLDAMMEKSMKEGTHGHTANGQDILMGISKYEQTNAMSPGLLAEVQAFRNGNRAVTH
jgi:hypothetical protein